MQSAIINSDQLKLLSSSILIGHSNKPFPYISQEYGAKWIIEGQINSFNNIPKVTLSLVDARTTLVVYSLTSDGITQESQMVEFCQQFIDILQNNNN